MPAKFFEFAGGDQMTATRTRDSQRIMSNSKRDDERLEGSTAVTEDWHAKVMFLEVTMYMSESIHTVACIRIAHT